MQAGDPRVGVVVIGRNEGERLERCLRSVLRETGRVVYADSGSGDGSADLARALGVEAVEVDPSRPFTAARGRNEGFERLLALHPGTELVQFLDGDCELLPGWLEAGAAFLSAEPGAAAVCGRLRERNRDASIYKRLADMEWNLGEGEVPYCGGNAMHRARTFVEAGGFDPSVIAGEEPDLCLRLRRAGHRVHAVDRPMALHDSAMYRLVEWWTRGVRAGHAYAEGAALHGRRSGDRELRRVLSIAAWGGLLPGLALGLAPATAGASALLLAAYGILWARVYRHRRSRGDPPEDAALYATATSLGKVAEMQGMARFARTRLAGRPSRIIEHREASRPR